MKTLTTAKLLKSILIIFMLSWIMTACMFPGPGRGGPRGSKGHGEMHQGHDRGHGGGHDHR